MAQELKKKNSIDTDIELSSADVPTRISWRSISSQVISVMNIERGVFYTLIELLFRPGKAVRIHLIKNRKRLLNPVRFLVLSTTLATIVTFHYFSNAQFTEAFEEGFNSGKEDLNSSVNYDSISQVISRFSSMMKQFINLSYFFIVPVGAMISWFLMRKKYNVPELAVANAFMWSMVNCVTLLFTPFMAYDGFEFIGYGTILTFSMLYPIFFYTSFFNEGVKGFFKALLVNGINLFLVLIFFVILTVITFWDIETLISPNSSSF